MPRRLTRFLKNANPCFVAKGSLMEAILLTQYPADGVAVLRLNRPGVLNALNLALRQALAEHVSQLEQDEAVKVIVLASRRCRYFGPDLLSEYRLAPCRVHFVKPSCEFESLHQRRDRGLFRL